MKILLLLASAVLASANAQDAPTLRSKPTTLQAGPHEYAAEVGHLAVPENRAAKGSRTIQLAFVRLKSTSPAPGPPVVLLPGGPGNSATALARSPAWAPYLELGDVLLLDPRGVGRSEPDLLWTSDAIHPELFFADRATAVGHMAEVCRAASADLEARGVDLQGYTTVQMAQDVEDLRRALGYERVNLFGHSFGTHLGLAILRSHPGTVARFVSVGTAGTGDIMKLPSDLDASLAALSEAVAADSRIGDSVPDLSASLERALASLRREPLPVPVTDPETGRTRLVELGPFGLQLILVADLGDTSDLPVFPRLLRSIEERDPHLVSWFLAKRLRQFSALPLLTLTARGSAGADEARWLRIRREARESPFGLARCMFSPESDLALGVADLGDAFRRPVTSDVPTLFISGTLDAHTPPEQAERVRAGFPNAGHLVVENVGHEDLIPDPEVQERILAFLAGDEPEDAFLLRPPIEFALLEGPDPRVDHPALQGMR